jgi:hypothetical protein
MRIPEAPLNDRLAQESTEGYFQGRCPAPYNKDGAFQGDLCYTSLRDLISRDGLGERWRQIGVSIGLADPPPNPSRMTRRHRMGRCYEATWTGGVWRLAEFGKLCEDTEVRRRYLETLSRLVFAAGSRVVAVPEDVLTLLTVLDRRECFGLRQQGDLGFNDELTDALADSLPMFAVLDPRPQPSRPRDPR